MSDAWIDEVVNELMEKHRIILDTDDPILVSALLHKLLTDKIQSTYTTMSQEFIEKLAAQLKDHNEATQAILTHSVHQLIEGFEESRSSPAPVVYPQSPQSRAALIISCIVIGFVLGALTVLILNP